MSINDLWDNRSKYCYCNQVFQDWGGGGFVIIITGSNRFPCTSCSFSLMGTLGSFRNFKSIEFTPHIANHVHGN